MKERELIDLAMKSTGYSQNKLAEKVGIKGATLSLMGSGKGTVSDEVYVKLAELAGIDPMKVLIEKHKAKAGPEAQKVWQRIGAGLSAAAFGAVILTGGLAGSGESKASVIQQVSGISSYSTGDNSAKPLYIMLNTVSGLGKESAR